MQIDEDVLREVEAGPLEQRLRGRARFLYERGEIKSPGLMMEAADTLAKLRNADSQKGE